MLFSRGDYKEIRRLSQPGIFAAGSAEDMLKYAPTADFEARRFP